MTRSSQASWPPITTKSRPSTAWSSTRETGPRAALHLDRERRPIPDQGRLGGRVHPARNFVRSAARGCLVEGHLVKAEPYTGMGAGPSRSDRPMRENHRGFPSYVRSTRALDLEDPRLTGGNRYEPVEYVHR